MMKRQIVKNRHEMMLGIVTILLLSILVNGCGTLQTIFGVPEEAKTEAGVYYLARKTFNDYWETYLDYRDSLPDGPKKQALRNKFDDVGTDSIFTKGNKALDAWREVIGTPDVYAKEKIFDLIMDEIMKKLLSEELIEIKVD